MHMTFLRSCLLAVALVLIPAHFLDARIIQQWTDQQLLDKSDLVVEAVPTATHDTKERGPLPGSGQPVIGVQTDFAVTSVLKGAPTTKTISLHHYRPDKMQIVNAPTFVSFDPKDAQTYRLYLVRQPDGLYAPVAGQEDPGLSIAGLSLKETHVK